MEGTVPFFAFNFLKFYECLWKHLLFPFSDVKLYIVVDFVIKL